MQKPKEICINTKNFVQKVYICRTFKVQQFKNEKMGIKVKKESVLPGFGENQTAIVCRKMTELRRNYTVTEERIFLNTCILAKCPRDKKGNYSGYFGEVCAPEDDKSIIELTFFIKNLLPEQNSETPNKNYETIRKAFNSFSHKCIYALAPNGRDWIQIFPFSMIVSNTNSGKVHVQMIPSVWKAFTCSDGEYNRISAEILLRLHSKYSIKIYGRFASLNRPITFNIETFKQWMCLENKYNSNKDFIKRAIQKAFGEINHQGVLLTYEINRNGNGRTSQITSITVYPEPSDDRDTIAAVKKYGLKTFLGEEETNLLLTIFSENELCRNIKTLISAKWSQASFESQNGFKDLLEQTIKQSKHKTNPKGWIVTTLKNLPQRKINPLQIENDGQ
ncbi:MAG: replication initiation protein [Bacteroidales bacterium]|nr:replication initiation protein [Bacteroidales bacterium]